MPKDRKPRPQYEIEVDRDLFAYSDAIRAIEHQKTKLVQLAFADIKFMFRDISSYGASGSQRGNPKPVAETVFREAEGYEAIIQVNRNYIDSILGDIEYAFQGDKEIFKFIELYWWTFPRTSIKIRKDVVIGNMQFLKQHPSGWEPFYDYRKKIYIRLAEVWGYKVDLQSEKEVTVKKT